MYLEINGTNYVIHLKSNHKHISIRKINDADVHLNVPVDFPQDYLISYIKTELQNDISRYTISSNNDSVEIIQLFDKNFKINNQEGNLPYIKGETIFVNLNNVKSIAKRDFLKKTLLLNKINSLISSLEDELNVLFPTINLKKFKTKYFSICPKTNTITYNKTLVDKSQDFITYVVVQSFGNYFDFSTDRINTLAKKYVHDYKHCERILKYEQERINT